MSLNREKLQEMLNYDPQTGIFVWRVDRGKARKGAPAGRRNDCGYIIIRINGRGYRAHRLAWLWTDGNWPSSDLDHINGNRSDNRVANLREATRAQNNMNARLRGDNKTGFKGVFFNKQNRRWQARVTKDGRQIHAGCFDTAEQAHAAYYEAAKLHFGEYARGA